MTLPAHEVAVVGNGHKMPVMEIFGPVVQGEGALIGRQTFFVRLGYCDYHCSWCDTLYAVEPQSVLEQATWLTTTEIVGQILTLDRFRENAYLTPWVTISGGNPALQKRGLGPLISMLQALGYKVAIETQGSYWNEALLLADLVTLSPKPPSSGMKTNWAILDKLVEQLAGRFSFKVVVFDDTDYAYAKTVYKRYLPQEFFLQVGTPALGDEAAPYAQVLIEKLTWLVDKVTGDYEMAHAIPLFQMHTLLFGQRKGI